MLQNTNGMAPRQDPTAAPVLKSEADINEAWRLIMEKRRLVQPDDALPINDTNTLAAMFNEWKDQWMDEYLTREQLKQNRNKNKSRFTAWLKNTVGGKNFVMALWQTGITWSPPQEMLNTNYNRAAKHVVTHFASWTRRLARAINRHQTDKKTVEARARSGKQKYQHGLTDEELQLRTERDVARRNYYQTLRLERELEESKGKGKGSRKTVTPKTWDRMSRNDQKWLQSLWAGELLAEKDRAEAQCHEVQADYFMVTESDGY